MKMVWMIVGRARYEMDDYERTVGSVRSNFNVGGYLSEDSVDDRWKKEKRNV